MDTKAIRAFDNWPELALGRLLFRRTQLQVHRVNGWEMIVDHRGADAGSIRSLMADNSSYRQLLNRVDLPEELSVVDMGANAGGFPFLLHAMGHSFKRLLCVEMNPNTYARLHLNVKRNEPRAVVMNAAVVGKPRTLELDLGHGSTGDSIYRASKGKTDPWKIDGLTFDQLVRPEFDTIDLVKIDVEGAEEEFLTGDAPTCRMLERSRYLVIEIHHGRSADDVWAAIKSLGFSHVAREKEGPLGLHLFAR